MSRHMWSERDDRWVMHVWPVASESERSQWCGERGLTKTAVTLRRFRLKRRQKERSAKAAAPAPDSRRRDEPTMIAGDAALQYKLDCMAGRDVWRENDGKALAMMKDIEARRRMTAVRVDSRTVVMSSSARRARELAERIASDRD